MSRMFAVMIAANINEKWYTNYNHLQHSAVWIVLYETKERILMIWADSQGHLSRHTCIFGKSLLLHGYRQKYGHGCGWSHNKGHVCEECSDDTPYGTANCCCNNRARLIVAYTLHLIWNHWQYIKTRNKLDQAAVYFHLHLSDGVWKDY